MNYNKMLETWYERASNTLNTSDGSYALSKIEFTSKYIFGFETYDKELDEMWVKRALEIALMINEREQLTYKSRNFYCWYVTMLNMEFFKCRTVWNGGISGASWLDSEFVSDGITSVSGEPIAWEFTANNWKLFIVAVDQFVRKR